MRKFFSLIAAVLFAGSMMADSYTITFKDNGSGSGDNSTSLTSTTVTDYVAEGADYVSAVAVSGKVYNGQEGYGLKFGNSSNPGSITLTLAAAVTPTSIVMNASPWSSSEGSGLLQDSVFATKSTGAKGTFADFTYYYDGATEVTTIVVGTSVKRGYVKSVTVNFEGGVTPPEPTCTLSDFLGNGSGNAAYTDRFKVCLPEGVSVVNIQSSFGTEAGIYLTFPGADFGAVSLDATQYATQGAGMLLYVSAFLSAAETEVTVECGGVTYTITVLNANPETTPIVLADPTNCAEAAEAALSVSANNELYNDGAVYTIEGYVTGIKTAYSDQYHNISFWMADAADGGEVLQAYRAACASEADAPQVGDKVAVTGKLTKYGTTPEFAAACTYVILERATPVEPEINYYVVGSMTDWAINADYKLAANSANEGEFMGEFAFENGAEFKVVSSADGEAIVNWFPAGMNNNYQITEAGDYTVYFRPEGGVDGWHEGYINAVKKEAPIVHQYEVAEAIAAGLQENDEVLVRGVITKIEFKGKNFAKYGSVNIYVADATDAEGEFEFYNCYSLEADTFRTSTPAYDPESTAWAQFREVVDGNGNAIHVGDTVIAFGKYKLYNSVHELNTGCYLVDIKHAPQVPADTIKLDFNTENTTYAFVDNQYFSEYGSTDIYLSDINVNTSTNEFEGDGNYLVLDFYPENANNVTGVYQALDETLDLEYTYMLTINGTDTAVVEFADGAIQVEIGEVNKELGMAQLALAGQLISTEGDIYAITALVIAYYDFLPEEGVEDVVIDPKAIKRLVNGNVVIIKNGVHYNVNGQVIK